MMHKSFRSLASAGTLLCLAAATGAAQSVSDHIMAVTPSGAFGGMFAPGLAGPGFGPGAEVTTITVITAAKNLCAGSDPDKDVCGVLMGGSTGTLGVALAFAGAPAAQADGLTNALSKLGRMPSRAALAAAIQAFNALIRAAPASFINKPPAQVGSIRAALLAIRKGF
jgi:hypothetical protein